MKNLLIATNNPGKLLEITDLLSDLPARIVAPHDLKIDLEVAETGSSYAENARLKATAFLKTSHIPSLADDTGLEVDALGGAPGLHSKRYAPEPGASDADRRRLLLKNLQGLPRPWTARFVCVVALALPDDRLITTLGAVSGEIIPEERGMQGFGYDSTFFFNDLGKTMAELDLAVKNRVSHRALAVLKIIPVIEAYLKE